MREVRNGTINYHPFLIHVWIYTYLFTIYHYVPIVWWLENCCFIHGVRGVYQCGVVSSNTPKRWSSGGKYVLVDWLCILCRCIDSLCSGFFIYGMIGGSHTGDRTPEKRVFYEWMEMSYCGNDSIFQRNRFPGWLFFGRCYCFRRII